jgi:tRNA threonylcarbamoyl adenosine modification protein (Sua5/YciO/YrdC/YwlC family)
MLLKVYTDNPSPRHLKIILDALKQGKVLIYPTDTVYAMGCDIYNNKAIDKICKIINKKSKEANMSLICSNLSNISEFTGSIDKSVYKLMRRVLPGPYTFILNASSKVPKIFKRNKKTVGIRIPDSNLIREIVEEYGSPIVTSSIHDMDTIKEYLTDPQEIYEKYKNLVDIVIDGGPGGNIPSTVLDCTSEKIKVVRQGKGSTDFLK